MNASNVSFSYDNSLLGCNTVFCVLRAQLDEGAQHTRSKAHLDGIKIQTIIMNVNNGHYAMVNASQAN